MRQEITILIAEDDPGHFILTKHCLQSAGITNDIVWLSDGQKTLDFIDNYRQQLNQTDRPEYILLLDIRMPKIDGLTILQNIKQDSSLKHIPVVIVTTSNNPANEQMCCKLGCDGYVVKPLDNSFISVIKSAASSLN